MLSRRIRSQLLLGREFSTTKPKSSIFRKLYLLSKLLVRGSILGGIGYFFYHTLKKGQEVQYPEMRRPMRFTPEESLELKQLNEIEQFAQIPLGQKTSSSSDLGTLVPDTVIIEENKHPSLDLPAEFKHSQFQVEMKELTNTINSMRDVLRNISKDFEEEAASRMKEHEKQELQLKQILERIEALRHHKFSQVLQNQQKWLAQLKIGGDELVVVMAELMQLSIKEIRKLEQYMLKFDDYYKDVLKTVQLIALSDACTVFFSDLSLNVKAYLNDSLNQEDDYYRELLNAKYRLELEIIADKAAQVEQRTKRNSERAMIQEAAHNFHLAYLKEQYDKRDFIVKLKLLISLLESAVIQQKSFANVLVYFRALSKKDALLESAYDGFVKDDPKVVRGVPNIYNLQREWKRLAPQAQIAQYYSVIQPKFFEMGLILLWYKYLRLGYDRYNPDRLFEQLFIYSHFYKGLKTETFEWEEKQCDKIFKAVDKLDLTSHYLKYNKLEKAFETIEHREIQDTETIDNFKNKLQRRIKLEELRSFLIEYSHFLQKTV